MGMPLLKPSSPKEYLACPDQSNANIAVPPKKKQHIEN